MSTFAGAHERYAALAAWYGRQAVAKVQDRANPALAAWSATQAAYHAHASRPDLRLECDNTDPSTACGLRDMLAGRFCDLAECEACGRSVPSCHLHVRKHPAGDVSACHRCQHEECAVCTGAENKGGKS